MALSGDEVTQGNCRIRPIITIDLAKNGINFENDDNGDSNTLILSLKQSD